MELRKATELALITPIARQQMNKENHHNCIEIGEPLETTKLNMIKLPILILLIGLLTSGQVNGQLILTEQENLTWVNKLKGEKELPEQLNMLRSRLLADTNVFVRNTMDRIILNKDKPIGLCKPRLMVDGHLIQPTNDTDAQIVKNLTKELTTDQIKHLEVADEKIANALFGPSGWCGLVLLTPKNKKTKRALLRYKI